MFNWLRKNNIVNITAINKTALTAYLPKEKEFELLGLNLSCIIKELYLNLKNKT